jgi:DNA-binding transcriptional LysR family regulator
MRCFRRRGAKRELELFSRDRLGDLVEEGLDLAIRFGEPRLPDAAVLTILNFSSAGELPFATSPASSSRLVLASLSEGSG